VWGVGASPSGPEGATVVDAASNVRFPMVLRWDAGRLTLANEQPFGIEFNGFQLPFELFRVSTRTDATGAPLESPAIVARAVCGQINVYGAFLRRLGFCNPASDVLLAYGAANMRLHEGGVLRAPAGLGTARVTITATEIRADFTGSTLRADAHNFGILALDGDGNPRPLDYVGATRRTARADGTIERVTLSSATPLTGRVRAYVMVDAFAAAAAESTP
jgi:hypothetical protein